MFGKCLPYLLFLTFFGGWLLIQTVSSIKCWRCRSDVDPKCADPFNNDSLPIFDCNKVNRTDLGVHHLPTMCRKTRQKVEGQWRFIRDCAWLGNAGFHGDERICNYTYGTYNIFVEHCNCKSKDGCNSSEVNQVPFIQILASLLATLIFYFMSSI